MDVLNFLATEAYPEGSRHPGSPDLIHEWIKRTPESGNTTVLPVSSLWAPRDLTPRMGFSIFTTGEAHKLNPGIGISPVLEFPKFPAGSMGGETLNRLLLTPRLQPQKRLRAKPRPEQLPGGKPGVGPFPPPDSPGLKKVLQLLFSKATPPVLGRRPESRELRLHLPRRALV